MPIRLHQRMKIGSFLWLSQLVSEVAVSGTQSAKRRVLRRFIVFVDYPQANSS